MWIESRVITSYTGKVSENLPPATGDRKRLTGQNPPSFPDVDPPSFPDVTDKQAPIPSLQLDKAIVYANNQWPRLIRFLDEPLAPIDNTFSERASRGSVLGRKNHYGSHSELGTRVAALFYSLTETCKLLDVDPAAYMNEAARRRLLDPADVLTPHAWREQLPAPAAVTP